MLMTRSTTAKRRAAWTVGRIVRCLRKRRSPKMPTDWEAKIKERYWPDYNVPVAVLALLREFQAEAAAKVRSFNHEGKAKEKYVMGGLPYLFRHLCGDIASEIESMIPAKKEED